MSHERNPLVRWGRKIESLTRRDSHDEHDHEGEHEHGQGHHHEEPRHHHEQHKTTVCVPKVTEEQQTQIVVNVNIGPISSSGCCPTGSNTGGVGGTSGPGGAPGRPVHTTGSTDGSIVNGVGTVGAITAIPTRPPNVWPGPRSQLYLPVLFIRHIAGDTGARPIQGTFWESPDIIVLPGVPPALAPDKPPEKLGGYAKAGADNTVYAHVWNLGQAVCWRVLVEFYWFNPTLGFESKDANLIGHAHVNLSGRGSRGCHTLVKCPISWRATYENGGHECLVVRVSHPVKDPLANPAWDARQNRKVAQRNIHVMTAAEAAANPTIGVNVGPLFGAPATVNVARADTVTMPWLHLVTMSRTNIPGTGAATGDVGITGAVDRGTGLPDLGKVNNPRGVGLIADNTQVNGEGKQVGFVATDGDPGAGKAHVYRVSGAQGGQTFGGYTVVVIGG
ncbi:MAG: hypothetical protein M1839_001510 [Geoglossum umbratile]|nr:MAG: hypothetical protein M1839_001510 [Geoglossum umbratile]